MLPSTVVRTVPACVCINTQACIHTNIVVILSDSEYCYVGRITGEGKKGTYFPRPLLFMFMVRAFALLILHLFSESQLNPSTRIHFFANET